MGLIKTLYDKLHRPPVTAPVVTVEGENEVRAALERADSALVTVANKEVTVDSLTTKLQDQLSRNHFAEMIELSMRPGV